MVMGLKYTLEKRIRELEGNSAAYSDSVNKLELLRSQIEEGNFNTELLSTLEKLIVFVNEYTNSLAFVNKLLAGLSQIKGFEFLDEISQRAISGLEEEKIDITIWINELKDTIDRAVDSKLKGSKDDIVRSLGNILVMLPKQPQITSLTEISDPLTRQSSELIKMIQEVRTAASVNKEAIYQVIELLEQAKSLGVNLGEVDIRYLNESLIGELDEAKIETEDADVETEVTLDNENLLEQIRNLPSSVTFSFTRLTDLILINGTRYNQSNHKDLMDHLILQYLLPNPEYIKGNRRLVITKEGLLFLLENKLSYEKQYKGTNEISITLNPLYLEKVLKSLTEETEG